MQILQNIVHFFQNRSYPTWNWLVRFILYSHYWDPNQNDILPKTFSQPTYLWSSWCIFLSNQKLISLSDLSCFLFKIWFQLFRLSCSNCSVMRDDAIIFSCLPWFKIYIKAGLFSWSFSSLVKRLLGEPISTTKFLQLSKFSKLHKCLKIYFYPKKV